MRIDVFFDVYPHPAKPYFESQLTEWLRQGHELRLFSFGNIPGATSRFAITPIATLRQSPVRVGLAVLWRCITNPARSWRAFRASRRIVQGLKELAIDAQLPRRAPEVNFVHNLATAVSLSYLKRACPIAALAIYYHGGEIPGVRQIPFEESSRALGSADVVFSNTRASVAEAVSRGAPMERTARIPVGFPLECFRPPEDRAYLPFHRCRFVSVGRMAREKGFDVALHALAALRKTSGNFHLTLIGDGPELGSLKALAERLSLSGCVTFRGHVAFDALIQCLADFDALVFSSLPIPGSNWRDTQACVLQEAMLMGTIVVASDFGGVRESLPPALQAYLYTPGSAQELTERLSAVMSLTADEVRSLGHIARGFVEANYDIRTINQRLLAAVATAGAPSQALQSTP